MESSSVKAKKFYFIFLAIPDCVLLFDHLAGETVRVALQLLLAKSGDRFQRLITKIAQLVVIISRQNGRINGVTLSVCQIIRSLNSVARTAETNLCTIAARLHVFEWGDFDVRLLICLPVLSDLQLRVNVVLLVVVFAIRAHVLHLPEKRKCTNLNQFFAQTLSSPSCEKLGRI